MLTKTFILVNIGTVFAMLPVRDYLLEKIYFETFDKNLNFGIYSYPLSVLCVLLLINAINLIDGINGLAMMVFIIIYLYLHYYQMLKKHPLLKQMYLQSLNHFIYILILYSMNSIQKSMMIILI